MFVPALTRSALLPKRDWGREGGVVGFSAPARIVSTHTHKYKIDVSGRGWCIEVEVEVEGGGNRLGCGVVRPCRDLLRVLFVFLLSCKFIAFR